MKFLINLSIKYFFRYSDHSVTVSVLLELEAGDIVGVRKGKGRIPANKGQMNYFYGYIVSS